MVGHLSGRTQQRWDIVVVGRISYISCGSGGMSQQWSDMAEVGRRGGGTQQWWDTAVVGHHSGGT